jgi:hypothetical protein
MARSLTTLVLHFLGLSETDLNSLISNFPCVLLKHTKPFTQKKILVNIRNNRASSSRHINGHFSAAPSQQEDWYVLTETLQAQTEITANQLIKLPQSCSGQNNKRG